MAELIKLLGRKYSKRVVIKMAILVSENQRLQFFDAIF